MNRYETKFNRALIIDTPLFASVWLALFSELRKNYFERRVVTDRDAENLHTKNEK